MLIFDAINYEAISYFGFLGVACQKNMEGLAKLQAQELLSY